ncbi:MAG: formiminoglutamase [Actinomycetota bacterium]|nr:formiminoglutamase [Actinomycetota bacterium]
MALPVDPLWPRAGDWPLLESADFGIVGVPTFRTSLSPTRAGTTPAAVREALRLYSEPAAAGALARGDFGDIADPDDFPGAAAAAVSALRARLLVAIGGDNSLTVPVALGCWGTRIRTAGLVTLDAHHDLRDGHSNGSPVRELIEAGLAGTRVVQVGIAEFANSAEYAKRAADLGITVVARGALRSRPIADVMDEALAIAASAGGPVHVDLDVDVCDRSVVPACPAAVPGGISADELRVAARTAARHGSVESIDIAEIDATADAPDGRTVRLAALLILECLAGLAER